MCLCMCLQIEEIKSVKFHELNAESTAKIDTLVLQSGLELTEGREGGEA